MDPHNTGARAVRGLLRWCYYTLRRAGDDHSQAHAMITSSATRAQHKLTNPQIQKHETNDFMSSRVSYRAASFLPQYSLPSSPHGSKHINGLDL